jgi:large subunit ribosomal protein L36e
MSAAPFKKPEVKKTGFAVGLGKGFIVTPRVKRVRQSQKKGKTGERVKQVRALIREVAGWAPYEKRIMEILKGGGNNPTKRAWRFAKQRLGTHSRAKKKVNEMTTVNRSLAQRAAQASKVTETKKVVKKTVAKTSTKKPVKGKDAKPAAKDAKKEKKEAPAAAAAETAAPAKTDSDKPAKKEAAAPKDKAAAAPKDKAPKEDKKKDAAPKEDKKKDAAPKEDKKKDAAPKKDAKKEAKK